LKSSHPITLTNHRLRLTCILALAATLTVACSGAKLPDDGPPPTVSTQAAASFLKKVLAVSQGAVASHQVRFTITDAEVTSALNLGDQISRAAEGLPGGLTAQEGLQTLTENQDLGDLGDLLARFQDGADDTGLDLRRLRPRLIEPLVYFKGDGRMIVRGEGVFMSWRLPLRVVVAPRAAGQTLELDFIEGQVGTVGLPELLFDPLGKLLAHVLLAGREYAEIQEITVADGAFTFAGRLEDLP
jgi:hypothetical protein